MGSIVGYTTTANCDFAQRSFYCYFQDLSPCQANWSASMVPLSPSVYRYQAFDRTMIPKEFQRHGDAFWWGALQYYVFMHMHRGIVDKYITNEALRDVLNLRAKGKRPRPSSRMRGSSVPLHAQGGGHRQLQATTTSTSTFIADGGVDMNRFEQRRQSGGPRSRRDAPAPRSSLSSSLCGPVASSQSAEWTRVPNGKRTVPFLSLPPSPTLTSLRALFVGNIVKTNGTTVHQKLPQPKARPQRPPPVGAPDDDPNENETLPFVRRSLSTLAAAWLPRIGVHVRAVHEDPKLPTQMMLTPTNAALRTQSVTLADVDEQIRSSSLCPLRFTFESPRYTQCFTPIHWPPTVATHTHTIDHWRLHQLLRAAALGTTPLVYREHICAVRKPTGCTHGSRWGSLGALESGMEGRT
jgi:hypothetical protein